MALSSPLQSDAVVVIDGDQLITVGGSGDLRFRDDAS